MAYLIKGVSILGAEPTDLYINDGVISAPVENAEVVDAAGLVALPGLVDVHTHLREPGREDAETVETGSRAAALGGYTAVCAMANTSPVADTAGVVEQVWRLGREAGLVDVQPIGAVTVGLAGKQMAELGAMATSAANVRIFSDDGFCVADPKLMRRALEYVKAFDGVIAQHAEEPRLTEGAQMHEGEVSTRLGLTGWPAVAEEAIIARDVLLAEHVGSRLHVCHVSTAGSVEVLRQALLDGVIDVVATDHAPHAVQDKECEWAHARPGMLGLETALPIVLSIYGPQWELIADRMSRAPARIAGLAGHGGDLTVGSPANLTLVDPSAHRVVDPAELASRSRNTPYAGMTLPGRIVATFLRGEATVLDGKAVK
jgi:dihydroorotase